MLICHTILYTKLTKTSTDEVHVVKEAKSWPRRIEFLSGVEYGIMYIFKEREKDIISSDYKIMPSHEKANNLGFRQ